MAALRRQQKLYEMSEQENILKLQVNNMTAQLEELAAIIANAIENTIHVCEKAGGGSACDRYRGVLSPPLYGEDLQ